MDDPNFEGQVARHPAVLKLPELLGSQGDHVRGQALVGALAAAVTAYLAVRFLLRYFETDRLTPFGVYCLIAASP
jgi:undecaprenyl-diphosphatase